MTHQVSQRALYLGLLIAGMLLMSGSMVAMGQAPIRDAHPTSSVSAEQVSSPTRGSLAPASVGMSDLISQTFEFVGPFPAGWQTYSAISHTIDGTVSGDYFWNTTAYTSAEGARSAVAVLGGVNGSTLTDSASYTAAVDSWLVYGPVPLTAVWQVQLDWKYLHLVPLTSSRRLTVAVSTDYDPVSRTGTFNGQALTPTLGWASGTLDLSPYAGHPIYVAFRYQSPDGGTVSDGPFVDDVHLRANYRVYLPNVSKWTLTVSKSAPGYAWMGQPLVYSITVHNTDNATPAYPVMIKDTLPANTTFAGADGGGTYSGGVVSWSGLTVPPGASIVQHLTVTIPSDAPFGYRVVNSDYSVSAPPNPTILYGLPVTTTVVGTFYDDFSDSSTGWPVNDYDPVWAQTCWPPPGPWQAHYLTSGVYGVNTNCAWNGWVYTAPVRLADAANFTVQVDLRDVNDFKWYSSYGIFFNGSENLRELYIVRLFQGRETDPEWEVSRWMNFRGTSSDEPVYPLYWGSCWTCDGHDYQWNQMAVRRQGNVFEVYMGTPGNMARMAVINEGVLVDNNHTRIGLYQGNFEWASFGSYYTYEFDNFKLTPAIK